MAPKEAGGAAAARTMYATLAVVSTALSWEEPLLFDTTTLHHLPAMRALLPTAQPNGTRSRRRRLGSARGARTAAVCVDHTADGHFTSSQLCHVRREVTVRATH